MNKLLTKIVGVALGATMAVGVGLAAAKGVEGTLKKAKAETVDIIYSTVGGSAGSYELQNDEDSLDYWTTDAGSNETAGSSRGLAWSKKAATLSYTPDFDVTGLVLVGSSNAAGQTISYKIDGGSSVEVGSMTKTNNTEYTFDGFSCDSGEEIVISITAGSKSTWVKSITLSYESGSAKVLTTLSVSGDMTKTSYVTTDSWSHAGLTATATFDDSSTSDVTESATWSYDPEQPNNVSITSVTATASYTYGGVTKTADSAPQSVTVEYQKGTVDNPYTVADAFAAIDAGTGLTGVYTSGIVSQIDEVSTQHGNATYWISDDGTTSGNQLEAYRGKYLNNTSFTSASQINVGDEVVVYGTLKKFNSTYEYDQGNYLHSISSTQPSLTIDTNLVRVLKGANKTAGVEYANLSSAITTSSNDEDVATVSFSDNEDGTGTLTVTGVDEGTAVITVSSGSISATLNVDVFLADADNVITFKKYGLTNAEDLDVINRSLFTVAFAKNSGSNAPKYYETDATARAYKDNTITVTSLDEQITEIDVAADASSTLTPDVGSYTTKTWTGKSQSVVFTVTATTKITSLTLTFDSGSTDPRVNSVTVAPTTLKLMTEGEQATGTLTATVDAEYGAPETVAWTSSDEDVAEVNSSGVVTAVAEGNCTITATSTFDDTKFASCAVTVIAADGPNEVTFSKQGYENGEDVTSFSKTNFDVEFASGSKYYDTGEAVRVYGGKSFTVSSNLEYNFTTIVLEFGSGESSNAISTDSGEYSSGTWTGNSTSVTFSVASGSGNRRIAKITVTFDEPVPPVEFIISGTVSGNNDFYVEDVGTIVVKAPEGITYCVSASDSDSNFFADDFVYDSSTQTFSANFIVLAKTATADVDVTFYFYGDNTMNALTYIGHVERIQIINPTGLDDARDFADFVTAECHKENKDWETLAGLYDDLSSEAKAFLVAAQYTLDGDDVIKDGSTHYQIADGMARYDYMVKTYHFDNFMGRTVESNRITPINTVNSTVAIIVVATISVISVSALGAYFLLRKKKEER